jgi:hypothetical protein
MFILKAQLELLGLNAPVFSWAVSFLLIAYSLYVYARHLKVSRNGQQVLAVAEKRLRSLRSTLPTGPSQGITSQAYEAVSAILDDLPLLQPLRQSISSTVIVRPNEKGEDRIWAGEEIRIDAPELIDNQSYKTAPTVISGVGLLATFLAILVALLDVKLAHNRVQGLDLLVQGLSGKFLSSVVAIGCATMLVYAERGLRRPINASITSLNTAVRAILPRLTPAQIMSNLWSEAEGQSRLMRSFGTDLAVSLSRGIDGTLRPTMERMASAIEDLTRVATKVQEEDRDVADERLSAVLTSFGQSLQLSLEKMAERFNDSLVETTHREFSGISHSLSTMVTLLQKANEQLTSNQLSFNDLVNLAKGTTADEIASRRGQIEQLTEVVSDLMVKVQERTEESTGSMERTIAAITSDMSKKMLDLSAQMARVVVQTSENSTTRAREVLDQAGSLSSRSAEQLARLLEHHDTELTKVDDLRLLLDTTIKGFVSAIGRYGEVTDGLRKVASQVNAGIASFGQVAKLIKDSQNNAAQVSLSVSGQMESMRAFAQSQQEVWGRIDTSMIEYEKIFARVEDHARDLLSQITQHLGSYSDTTQKHFVELTSTADNFISRATGRLSASIDELGEQLDELQGALASIGRMSRAAG